ncbi:hypothetical protein L1049_014786 [Liquidambar formosana]|uniref:EamA domain-containing protein n=1 Tax=Liquidambar formosana TaxID=63359 RepID=A0AAP0X219_LIQFO
MDHEIHIVEGDTPQAIEDSGTHLKEQVQRIATRSWPWVAVTVIVSLNAGLAIINKKALNEGLDHYVFSVYRNIIAVVVLLPLVLYFERTSLTRPTLRVVLLVCALAMLEPVMDQNFLYAGSHKTPASLSSSISITQPVFTFVLAWIFRFEHINIKTRPSQAKVLGTIISVGGAIIIATYTGQVIPLPWTNKSKNKPLVKGQLQEITIVGMIYCLIGVSSSAAYTILLAKTLPLYPAPLTLTTGTCLVGALINFIVAQVLGSRYGSRWMIDWNIMFLSYFYAGEGASHCGSLQPTVNDIGNLNWNNSTGRTDLCGQVDGGANGGTCSTAKRMIDARCNKLAKDATAKEIQTKRRCDWGLAIYELMRLLHKMQLLMTEGDASKICNGGGKRRCGSPLGSMRCRRVLRMRSYTIEKRMQRCKEAAIW